MMLLKCYKKDTQNGAFLLLKEERGNTGNCFLRSTNCDIKRAIEIRN